MRILYQHWVISFSNIEAISRKEEALGKDYVLLFTKNLKGLL